MFKVIYDPINGQAFKDGEVESKALIFFNCAQVADEIYPDGYTLVTANDLFINAVRVLIKRGEIPLEKVEFYYRDAQANDTQIVFDKNLRARYPSNYPDYMVNFLMEL